MNFLKKKKKKKAMHKNRFHAVIRGPLKENRGKRKRKREDKLAKESADFTRDRDKCTGRVNPDFDAVGS